MDSTHNIYKNIQLWSDGETKMLLDKYGAYLAEIGPLKMFKNKKEMWAQIAQDVGSKNAKQCEERFKTVMKRKKKAVDNNHTSGSKRQHVDFEEELAKICSLDDSLDPEIRISSQSCEIKDKNKENKKSKENSSRTGTMQQTLMEMHQEKEAARERRHKEKMEKADKLHELLAQLAKDKL